MMKLPIIYILFSFILTFSLLGQKQPAENSVKNYYLLPEQLYYDVSYYGLNFAIDVNNRFISGSAEIAGEIVQNNTSQIVLNLFDHMTVDSVKSQGQSLDFNHAGDVLTCNLSQPMNTGNLFTVTVFYNGYPMQSGASGYGLIFTSYYNNPLIYSYNWPYYANTFIPCKDHPSDKADSVQLSITVPDSFQVACNGILISTSNLPGNQKQFIWKSNYPTGTYHISINIYPFDVLTSTYNSLVSANIPLEFYTFPNHTSAAQTQLNIVVPQIHEAFENRYGAFPFSSEKSGFCESVISGGMEHQTILTMNYPSFFSHIIVHEAAHEYFGNMISISDWGHIWLSEGFATYSEAIFKEYWQGPAAYLQEIREHMSGSGSGIIYVSDPSIPGNIIPYNLVYLKASTVLHMLRFIMGDSLFFQMMQDYVNTSQFRFKNIDTDQFKNYCETYYGNDLDWFFDQWIFQSGKMSGEYYHFWNSSADTLIFKIHSNLSGSTYHSMPMPIEFSTSSDQFLDTLWVDSLNLNKHYYFSDSTNLNISIDPDDKVLKGTFTYLDHPNLDGAYLQQNAIHLNWSSFFDFTEYEIHIWRENSPGIFIFVNSVVISGLNYSFTPSLAGKYRLAVKAIKNGHQTKLSNPKEVCYTNFPMDQDILIIDETRNGNGSSMLMPTDVAVDSFYNYLLTGYSTTQFDVTSEGRALNVLDFAHYSTLIWHNDVSYQTIINQSESAIHAYMEAGGKIIFSGMNFLDNLSGGFSANYLGYQQFNTNMTADFTGAVGINPYPDLSLDTSKIDLPTFNNKLRFITVFDTTISSNTIYKFISASSNLSGSTYHSMPMPIEFSTSSDQFLDTLWVDSLNLNKHYYFSDSTNLNISIDPDDKVLKGTFTYLDHPNLDGAYLQQNAIHLNWSSFFDFTEYEIHIWRENSPGIFIFVNSVVISGLNYSFTPSLAGYKRIGVIGPVITIY